LITIVVVNMIIVIIIVIITTTTIILFTIINIVIIIIIKLQVERGRCARSLPNSQPDQGLHSRCCFCFWFCVS
jgi:hypothetical protein